MSKISFRCISFHLTEKHRSLRSRTSPMSNSLPLPPQRRLPSHSQSQQLETPPWETPSSRWYTPSTTPWRTPQSARHTSTPSQSQTLVDLDQVVISNQPPSQNSKGIDAEARKEPTVILRQTDPTNRWIWCGAGLCLVFSLVLIFFAIATLIIYLAIKPKTPVFDIPNANLNTIYFDSDRFNGDLSLMANFTNPNKKLNMRFEHLSIELFFSNRLIATQGIQSLSQRRGETRLEAIHLISSLVYLPGNHAGELKRQVQNNKINYEIVSTFKVRAHFGIIHFSYWVHGRCQLQMTGPPTGVLVSRNCSTKK